MEVLIVNVLTESVYAPFAEGDDAGEITRVREEEDREMLHMLTAAGLRCSMEVLGLGLAAVYRSQIADGMAKDAWCRLTELDRASGFRSRTDVCASGSGC